MQDILTAITDAETKADEIIKKAKNHADSVLKGSDSEIEKRKKEIFDSAEKHLEQIIEEKKLLAQFEADKIKEACKEDLKALEATAEKNMDKTVEFILNSL